MTVAQFRQRPFLENHSQYDRSCLSIGVQPEYATGDVLLGSCYRVLQLAMLQESEVNLEEVNQLAERLDSASGPAEMWRFLFSQALRSPVRPGESSARPLPQLVPLVPSLGNFSGVLGRPRSRWNPGRLAIYALACGTGPDEFPLIAKALANALDVVEEDDDEFAIFLERGISPLLGDPKRPVDDDWPVPELTWSHVPYRMERLDPLSPAEAFAQDLRELLKLKPSLTRRQWCALLESLLRLGLSTHVLWVCRLNSEAWRYALEVLGGSDPPSEDEVERKLWSGHLSQGAFLDGGQNSDSYFKRQVESYATARLGLNLLLHSLEDANASWISSVQDNQGLPAAKQLSSLLDHLSNVSSRLPSDPKSWVMSQLGKILDDQSSKVSGNSGSPKNLYEFLAHTLRRRPSKEPALNEHDQGYLLVKLPGPRNAPWVVRPGPVLLMAMCYSTWRSMQGAPVTLQHLATRFSFYGIRLSTGDLQDGVVANDLEALGILVDSPDAGGGRLVLNPFEVGQ
ncbi:hypothetical protein F4X33_00700 [Candidatus Poribacteria bacterium]|nr:hypothetical protein [Candidatus Poribacteria bacterium]